MEKKLAFRSGRILATGADGYSAIAVSAGVSVLILLAIVTWRVGDFGRPATTFVAAPGSPLTSAMETEADAPQNLLAASNPPLTTETGTTTDPDGIGSIGADAMGQLIGTYVVLKESGSYTKAGGAELAGTIAEYMRARVSYESFEEKDIETTADTSYDRMLSYRADLRESLAPLLENTEPEFELFGRYVETGDPKYLAELKKVAARYRDAVAKSVRVTTPEDLAFYHVAVLNALQEFATTLEYMAEYADDAFASLALLRTYNSAEARVLNSFNSLALAQADKKP